MSPVPDFSHPLTPLDDNAVHLHTRFGADEPIGPTLAADVDPRDETVDFRGEDPPIDLIPLEELADILAADVAPPPASSGLIPRSAFVKAHPIVFRQGFSKNETGALLRGAALDWRTGPALVPADANPWDHFQPYKVLLLDFAPDDTTATRGAIVAITAGEGAGAVERRVQLGGRPVAVKLGHYTHLDVTVARIALASSRSPGVVATWTNEEVQLDSANQLLPAPLQPFGAAVVDRITPKGAVLVTVSGAVTVTWHGLADSGAADYAEALAANATTTVKGGTFDLSGPSRLLFWLRPI
jgi:hypothetical protein